MIRYLTLAVCFVCFCSLTINGQNKQFKNSIKISPVQFANSTFELNYERFFNDKKQSIVISPALLLRETNPESLLGFKGNVQYRYYFTHLHESNNKTWFLSNIGFYAGAYAQYLKAQEEYFGSYSDNFDYHTDLFEKNISSVEGGVLLGIQIDIIPRFALDFNFGGGVKYADIEDTITPYLNPNDHYNSYGVLDREFTGVVPRGSLQLGFNF